MGEISEKISNSKGVPSGKTVPYEMGKIAGLHALRFNSARGLILYLLPTQLEEVYGVQ